MTVAGTRQLLRSRDVVIGYLIAPLVFLGLVALFGNLAWETRAGSIGFVDLLVTGLGVMMIANAGGHIFVASVATYKSTGVIKRISVTPVSPAAFMLGEIIPRVAYSLVMTVAFFAAGRALGAHIRITPALFGLLPVALLAAGYALSFAFFVAGTTSSPANANAFDSFTALVLFQFTGAMFPLSGFPHWVEETAQFLPYTGLVTAARGIALDAQPVTDFLPQLAIGAGWLAVMFALAARAYRFIK
jgi:ABC-2 type transport system permease protein